MDELSRAILRLHQAEYRVRQLTRGHLGPLSRQVVEAAAELRRAASQLEASALAVGVRDIDPIQAVAIVVEAAIAAGADWQKVVATVNRAGSARS